MRVRHLKFYLGDKKGPKAWARPGFIKDSAINFNT